MSFKVHTLDRGGATPFEYLEAGAITPKIGMALVQKNGFLQVAGATEKPSYISMYQGERNLVQGTEIPVIRVNEDIVFETTNQADFASIKVGDKVTLHTDGLQVTATKQSGVAEVVHIGGNAVGSAIRVRF